MYLEKPILRGGRILIYCRFSTDEQRSQSIDAQRLFCERFLQQHGCSDGTITVISDEGLSGELRSRPGIDEVRQAIASRRIDLVISEDSSRLYRDVGYALDLVGMAVDMRLRVICINDDVDTCRKDWRRRLIDAQQEHTQANDRTRARLSRTIEELWFSGAAIGLLRPGYRRILRNPSDRRSPKIDEIDPKWQPVIHEAYMSVAYRQTLERVARFLTDKGLPKFANSSSKVWNERNVLTLIRCELYKGIEFYRAETSIRSNATGKMRSAPNPEPDQILKRDMPHLRMVEDWEWDQANDVVDERARPGESISGLDHPLFGIPRNSRSLLSNIFVCGICGSKMYAEGRNEGGYRCSAARRGNCWNKTTCLRDLAHQRICASVSEALLLASPEVIEILIEQVQSLLADEDQLRAEQRKLAKQRADLRFRQQRLVDAITESKRTPAFLEESIARLEAEEACLARDEQRLQSQLSEQRTVPERDTIERRIREMAFCVSAEPDQAKALLPQLLNSPIRAVPYQPFGNRNVVLKAEFSLRLAQLLADELRLMWSAAADTFKTPRLSTRELRVELFQRSKPQEFALQALEFFRATDIIPTLEQIGTHLGISKRTAHLALQLGKKLDIAGLSDPFVRLADCPSAPARWRFKDAS